MSELRLSKGSKSALLWGYDTYVGRACLDQLILHGNYERIYIVAINTPVDDPKLHCISARDDALFDALQEIDVQDVYLCIHLFGRLRSSFTDLTKIEWYYTYPAKIMLALSKAGANQVILISSAFTFNDVLSYSMRALVELELFLYKINLWSVSIYKPAFITPSIKKENNFGRILDAVDNLAPRFLKSSVPIDLNLLASAIVDQAQSFKQGYNTMNHKDISKLVNTFKAK